VNKTRLATCNKVIMYPIGIINLLHIASHVSFTIVLQALVGKKGLSGKSARNINCIWKFMLHRIKDYGTSFSLLFVYLMYNSHHHDIIIDR